MAPWTNGVKVKRHEFTGDFLVRTKRDRVLVVVPWTTRNAEALAELIAEALNAPDICEMRGIDPS